MDTAAEVDKIWNSLGKLGRYQIFQLLIVLVDIIPWAFQTLSIVFIGYVPPFSCSKDVSITTFNYTTDPGNDVMYETCSVIVHNNITSLIDVTIRDCPNGMNYSVPKDRTIVTEFDLVCDKDSLSDLTQTLLMLGQGIGAIIFTPLADRFGRKLIHVTTNVLFFFAIIGISFSPNYIVYAILRVVIGALLAGCGLSGSILLLELFPKEIRGQCYTLGLLFWTTGCLLVAPIAYLCKDISWRYMQLALSAISVFSLFEYWLLDESLRWLIANGKTTQARVIIKKAAKWNNKKPDASLCILEKIETKSKSRDISNECEKISTITDTHVEEISNVKNGNPSSTDTEQITKSSKTERQTMTIIDVLKNKHMIKTSLLSWFMWITNSLTYYGIYLTSTKLAGNRFVNYSLTSVIEYPAFILQVNIINRIGRRKTCILFHCIAGVSLLTTAVLLATLENTSLQILPTVFTLIGKFGITGSFSTIYLYTPELYPTNLRNAGIGMSLTAGRIGGMVAPFTGALYQKLIWAPGTLFGIMCLTVSMLTFLLPETQGQELPQTLVELNSWYKGTKNKSKKPKIDLVSARRLSK